MAHTLQKIRALAEKSLKAVEKERGGRFGETCRQAMPAWGDARHHI
jgi:hypothetical protein